MSSLHISLVDSKVLAEGGGGEVALHEHPQESEGKADLHGWYQRVQA